MSPNGDKAEVARILAEAHREVDSGIRETWRVLGDREDEPDEPVKLLQVNEDTPALGLVPVFFGPDPRYGIPYSSIVVELAPEEFDDTEQTKTWLAERGWRLGHLLYSRVAEEVAAC